MNKVESYNIIACNFTATLVLWFFVGILIFYIKVRYGLENLNFDIVFHDLFFYPVLILYIIYLIIHFSSTGFRRIMQMGNLKYIIQNNIENTFSLHFNGSAWREEQRTDSDGDIEIVNIHTYYHQIYDFKSGCDFSKVIIDSKDIKNKKYINLEIQYEYFCADENTKNEHNEIFDNLTKVTKSKDNKYSVDKILIIPNSHKKNIVSFANAYVNFFIKFFYILFIFLSFGQIYKLIICFYMIQIKIKITKVISNYYDLSQADPFFEIMPTVKIFEENLNFDRNKFSFKNSDNLEIMPSENNKLNSELKLSYFNDMQELNNDNKIDNNIENIDKIKIKEKLI